MLRLSCLVPLILFAACAGSAEATGTSAGSLTGPIDVRIAEDTDADADDALPSPALDAMQIVVTITRVDARVDRSDAGADDDVWSTLSRSTRTVDLLSLPTGGFASLGVAQLPAGGPERLRLFVSSSGPNYVTTKDGLVHPLMVPTGEIQVTGDFDAQACASGFVTLAFAGRKSIAAHPIAAGGAPDGGPVEWVLRPVVRLRETVLQGAPCTNADDRDRDGGRGRSDRDH